MSLAGKGYYLWKVPSCENGNVEEIAGQAKSAGLSHVLIKIANGIYSYNLDPNTGVDHALNLTQALHRRGVAAWGWHYVFGNNPLGEAQKAIQRIQQLELDGYVIDAEEEYKEPGKREAARKFMAQIRSVLPDFPVALSSYRFPAYHSNFPWREFLEKCDINMPQVYWMKAANAGEQLTQCLRQFQALAPYRPILPTGAAFRQNNWQPAPEQVHEFLRTAKEMNLSAANFWEWSFARSSNLQEVWATIRDFPWDSPPGPQDICATLVDALNTRNADGAAGLYAPSAIHTNAARTAQGTAAILAWYNQLFTQILPEARYTLGGYSGTGSSRNFHWTAVSRLGQVLNGNDTLGLVGEKIVYHFTWFTVTPSAN
jgi:hypothetical protein